MNQHLFGASIVIVALSFTACSEAPKPETKTDAEAKKEAPKPTGPVSGKTAFYEMYKPARSWAVDLLPLSLTSNEVEGIKNEDGKYAMWTAVFVSPSKHEARTFTYAIADQGTTVRRGVTMGGAESWSGATPKSKPFQTTELAVDSDAAYKTALEKAQAWVKKHPDKTPALFLGSSNRFPAPAWYVLWGNTKLGYAVFVNATTGAVMTGK